MAELIVILTSTVAVFVTALSYLILARVLLQFFTSEESAVFQFCYAVTEPVVSPVRKALQRIDTLADSPMDFSYLTTFILLTIIRFFLPPIAGML